MFNPHHYGLYFTPNDIALAKQGAKKAPFKAVWDFLRESHPEFDLQVLHWNALRYRLDGDVSADESACAALEVMTNDWGNDQAINWQVFAETLVLAQCFEMLRDHPALSPAQKSRWLDTFFARVEYFNRTDTEPTQTESLWLAALNVAGGIVLEREPLFQAGVEVFRQTVDNAIHPEGYIAKAVQSGDGHSLLNQVLCVEALVLIAEAAWHAGVDLWSYSQRSVSIMTASIYPLYYYFYPEKWQWEAGIDLEQASALFRQHGGFLEILNRHIERRQERPLRAVRLILKDIRPIYDLYGGGLTTLTHGVAERHGLFG